MPHPVLSALGLWAALVLSSLYATGVGLFRGAVVAHGRAGLLRAVWAVPPLAFVTLVGWRIATALGSVPWNLPWPVSIPRAAVALDAALGTLLSPFRLLVWAVVVPDATRLALGLGATLGLLVLAWLWVVRGDAAFEEAATEVAERRARLLRELAAGRVTLRDRPRRVGRPPYRLGPAASPLAALVWAGLTERRRNLGTLWALSFAVLPVGVYMMVGLREHGPLLVLGSFAVLGAAWAAVVPVGWGHGLLDVNRARPWPLPARTIVLGELLPGALLTAVAQWGLLVVAVACAEGASVDVVTRVPVLELGIAALLVLPATACVSRVVVTAATLTWPAWVPAKGRPQSIEAYGMNLAAGLLAMAVMFVAMLAALPGLVVGAVVAVVGAPFLGWSIAPLAGAATAATLLFEAHHGVGFVAARWRTYDPSLDVDAAAAS
jgi:hypothetical protein